jgi:hypothetical protein
VYGVGEHAKLHAANQKIRPVIRLFGRSYVIFTEMSTESPEKNSKIETKRQSSRDKRFST